MRIIDRNYIEIQINNKKYYIRYKTKFLLMSKLEIFKVGKENSLGMRRLEKVDTEIIKLGTHKENIEFLINKILLQIKKKCTKKYRKYVSGYPRSSSS